MGDHSLPTTLSDVTDLVSTHPREARLAALAGGTLLWYGLPDIIRSRGVRVILKTGIAAGILSVVARGVRGGFPVDEGGSPAVSAGASTDGATADDMSDGVALLQRAYADNPATTIAVAAGGGVAVLGGIWASLRAERWLFRRGENRRAQGRFAPHLRQAVPLALLVAATELIDLQGTSGD